MSSVLYKSIPQLQEQNMKLLRCIRELGGRMERGESEYKEQFDLEQTEAIREAHEAECVILHHNLIHNPANAIQSLQAQLETTRVVASK